MQQADLPLPAYQDNGGGYGHKIQDAGEDHGQGRKLPDMEEAGLTEFPHAGKADLPEFKNGEEHEKAGQCHGGKNHDAGILWRREIQAHCKEHKQHGNTAEQMKAGKMSVRIAKQAAGQQKFVRQRAPGPAPGFLLQQGERLFPALFVDPKLSVGSSKKSLDVFGVRFHLTEPVCFLIVHLHPPVGSVNF